MSYRRIRTTDCPVLQVPLPPEIAASIRLAAVKSGMTPEQLAADVLRDTFEPVFEGRGALAVKEGAQS